METISQEELINMLEDAYCSQFNIDKKYLQEYRYLIEDIHTVHEEERLIEYRKNKKSITEELINKLTTILPEYGEYFKEKYSKLI